jgi:diketogulonate reductase-like aldo/keto reductase
MASIRLSREKSHRARTWLQTIPGDLQAFAALGYSSEPNLLDDSVITAIARRVNKTPAQVLLAWAIQRGTPS